MAETHVACMSFRSNPPYVLHLKASPTSLLRTAAVVFSCWFGRLHIHLPSTDDLFDMGASELASLVIKTLLACVLALLLSSSLLLLKFFFIFSGSVDILVPALSSTVVVDELLENCIHVILLPSTVLASMAFMS